VTREMRYGKRLSPKVRKRGVRRATEQEGQHQSQWGAISSVATKLSCFGETQHKWVGQSDCDGGRRPGLRTDELERVNALEREAKELRRANEILNKASAYLAQSELDRHGT
jgi:transposase